MITIKPSCNETLSCFISDVKSIAYDGCDYALLVHQRNEIIRLNENLCSIGSYPCAREYNCICFDTKKCCYYACAHDYPAMFYVLDLDFNEIGMFELECHLDTAPIAISSHPELPVVAILYPNEIIMWNLECEQVINTIHLNPNTQAHELIVLTDGYCISYKDNHKQWMEVCCFSNHETCVYEIPCDNHLLAMVLIESCKDYYEIQLLLQTCDTDETSSLALSITCTTDDNTPCPCPIPQPFEGTCNDGKNEVIHSIALEEAGIAHILNAEGEKLQKAVASDISIEELLMVNESVRKTITQITILEGQLYSKLESLHCLCPIKDNETN